MTEDLKEMLHCIEMNCKHNKCFGGIKLDEEDCKLLLNYITNLQQLYENALKVNQNENKYRTELESEYVLLQQENETLKAKLEIGKTCGFCPYYDYKQRNEKAIEYIKNLSNEPNVFGHYGIDTECKKWLLKILNGSDEK